VRADEDDDGPCADNDEDDYSRHSEDKGDNQGATQASLVELALIYGSIGVLVAFAAAFCG
jgi:hypothetical protein